MHAVTKDTVIDERYRVLERVGSGGMADVYCAVDLQLGRKVALKLLYRHFAEDEEFVERFRREASSAAGLQHPHVVAVFDRGEWDGTYYIAMEYLDGRPLKDIIRDEGPLEPARAVDIAVQVLKAAKFAHKRGIVHRDIKPHNVIVDDEGQAKVTDFGIARAGASDMTETGSIMGTAQYLSPEQAQGHAVSAQSDLYAIGIVLYEMLTGRVPFDAESAVTIALKQVSEEPVPPSQLNPAVSPELEDVVLHALRKDPAARFADAGEFADALERARDLPPAPPGHERDVPLTGAYPAPYEWEAEPRSRRRWVILGLVALAVAAIGLGAYLVLRPEQVTVPDVVNRNASSAAATLQNRGFEVDIEEARSQDVREDRVIRQRPGARSEAKEGSTVTLTVSTGPGEATIPEVAGLSRRRAEERLREAGFDVDVRRETSDTVAAGRVIGTTPDELSQQERGSTVGLIVSSGVEQVAVPEVRGAGRTEAQRRLEAAGFEVATQEQETEEQDPGTVLTQAPAPGTRVDEGSTVTITVAKRPAEVEVPQVTDLPLQDALAALQEAGLRGRQRRRDVDDPDDDGIVQAQNPDAGARRKRGSQVTITVGRYTEPEPTATPTPSPTATPTP